MGRLDRNSRRDLIAILSNIPQLDSQAGLNLLLTDLPPALLAAIPRADVPGIYLANILRNCDSWEVDPRSNSPHPLQIVIENACELVPNTKTAMALRTHLGKIFPEKNLQAPQVSTDAKPPCPYPGMEPFGSGNARFFYGRRMEVQGMVQHLRHRQFLLVIGPTGSGKSSLVFAGLVPYLNDRVPGEWQIHYMRPGSGPTATLAHIVETAGDSRMNQAKLRSLVIVDQLEELFTQSGPDELADFALGIKDLLRKGWFVIVALRADFYHDLLNSPLWPLDRIDFLDIAPLRGDALRQAIQQPAADVGVHLEEVLVERLLADAAEEPGRLPLLQETLQVLWDQMYNGQLTVKAYEELGREGRTGLAVALSRKADATLAQLTTAQRKLARRIFLRLVQFCEGRPDTRRQQPMLELRAVGDDDAVFDQTLQVLADNRLLTLSSGPTGKDRRVDLSHECLITSWPTLQGWISERREAEQTRRRLEDQAAMWVHRGRRKGALLDEVELPEVEHWVESGDAVELGVSSDLTELINASRSAVTTRLREQIQAEERQRLQGDLHEVLNIFHAGVMLELEILRDRIISSSLHQTQADLEKVWKFSRYVFSELRNILDAVRDPVLTTRGLVPALERYILIVGANKVECHFAVQHRLDQDIEYALYRIAQAAIENALRHSGVTKKLDGRVSIKLVATERNIDLEVRDNGEGFDVNAIPMTDRFPTPFGLGHIRQLAETIGGHLQISSQLGQGTIVAVNVPLKEVDSAIED